MRRELVFQCVIGLAMLSSAVSNRVLGGDLPSDFAAKYQPAAENLQRCYSHATISGTLRRENPRAKKLLEQQYVLRAAGAKFRLDITTTAEHGMGLEVGSTTSYIATPDGSLSSYRGPRSQVFDTASELSYSDVKSRIENGCPLIMPYKSVGQGTILEVLKLPNVRVDGVEKIQRDGETLVKVSYDESSGQKSQRARKSWFLLCPAEGWAVREYSRTTGDGDSEILHRGTLKYDGMHDGAPLVRRIEIWQEQGPRRECILHEIIEVSSFTPVDPSSYFFTAFTF
jgi:hypothetical protein